MAAAVGDGDGGRLRDEQRGHWPANDVGATDDKGLGAGNIAERMLEQAQAAQRGAGDKAGQASGEATGVDGVKAIDIFGGIYRRDHLPGIDMGRQRKLDEDAIDGSICVEALDKSCLLYTSRCV